MSRIAIVGMACRYPDATSPRELWENALAGRRAFRRLPDVRMRLEDYWDPDPATPDRFYARKAAVIEGYQFDRIAYKVAGSTYRSTDLTHWLALDMAALALADAGFPMAEGLPRERTGVVVGNTLTGEFSRANTLRLRWPYVRRAVLAALKEQEWDDEQLAGFLDQFEATYKDPFPAIDEDSLAGGLSNTIAGRICNHFDLNGGGYTVDGACSSSLLSVATACRSLSEGDVDVAIAGGVDLSIDPFEIIGFAKTGALATGEMKVYDRDSNGFWPGEGCGMVVLMRDEEARRAGHRVYASIAGFGISSDGRGGITRPEQEGYQLALRRAYDRAGFGIETVSLFEGHGTGTKVGDATELQALSRARTQAGPSAPPAAIGSVKAMIGHTKAAAGVAGLIKAAMAVHRRVLPPTLGCTRPHEVLTDSASGLRMLRRAEPWPAGAPLRAGVTAMGFGGINTHVVLEDPVPRMTRGMDSHTRSVASSAQDGELLLLEGRTPEDLAERVRELAAFVPQLAYAELADIATTLHRRLRGLPYRAAVVVASPEEAERQLTRIGEALAAGERTVFALDGAGFLGHAGGPVRLGFLFPGQGSGQGTSGGALRRRFPEVDEVYRRAALPSGGDMVATEVAQPRIVTGSVAGLRALSLLGIEASVAVGHSLGEISALHWAGSIDEDTLLRVAALRGSTMSRHSSSGTMAGIGASAEEVRRVSGDLAVVIAGYNSTTQTVIAGSREAVAEACRRATAAGLTATALAVSHAFHSPLVAPAAEAFRAVLNGIDFGPVSRRLISTVSGRRLGADTDVADLLQRQIVEPVLFSQALGEAAKDIDLFVEVGPGRVLSGLAATVTDVPAIALDTDDESLTGLLRVAGAAFVIGATGGPDALFHGRMTRSLELGADLAFFASPCETPPPSTSAGGTGSLLTRPPAGANGDGPAGDGTAEGESAVEMLRRLVAERAELPPEMVHDGSLLLDDLHLSSITVGQVVNQAAQQIGLSAAQAPTNFASATLSELADALAELSRTATADDAAAEPAVVGAGEWVRAWRVDLDETPAVAGGAPEPGGPWQVFAPAGHPLAEPLHRALEGGRLGGGVLVCLPEECGEEHLRFALDGARRALADGAGRYVLVQHGPGAAGLAKTLHLEAPALRVTILHVPPVPETVGWVVAEVAATTGYAEVHYDTAGVRRVPTMRALPVTPARTGAPLDGSDVVLVTGGGKGITAECALALAADSGAKLAVLGRSDPAADAELTANLRRMADAGIVVEYRAADVTDPEAVRRAVAELSAVLGPVTGVLHGAGRNEPAPLTTVDPAAFERTFAPKVGGLRTVLAAVDPDRLRLLVTFGSIIGRAGLRGEAHYATANDWLAELTTAFAADHPGCRALCLEWSVWSGVGMGEKLSVVESLHRDGITPITPDQGVRLMRRLLADPDAPTVVLVAGRTHGVDTVRYAEPALPLLRFLERPLVRYHGVELISEVTLNTGTDRYLADHLLDGNALLPAVFGMEAMAQVAAATIGRDTAPVFERAEFRRPIVVPPEGETTVRIAAVVVDDDRVDVVIRSAETGWQADHFTAQLHFTTGPAPDGPPEQAADGLPAAAIDPARDLYGDTLFQGELFQRLRTYHRAAARHVDATLAARAGAGWFAGFLPGELLLGDPGVRDALMHGNQVCVPDGTLLPAGIDRLHPAGPRLSGDRPVRYVATERSRDGDTYVYDIVLRTDAGEVIERWDGLRLRAVRKKDGRGPWVPALLGPYLQRTVEDLLGGHPAVAVVPDEPDGGHDVAARRRRTAQAAGQALGRPVEVRYRPDGRPEVDGASISAAHGAGLTLCITSDGTVACDVEPVAARPADDWRGLLGAHAGLADAIAAETGESPDTAATRVWSAVECLQKAGRSTGGPLTLRPGRRDAWLVLAAGDLRAASLVTTLRGVAEPVVMTLLIEER